MAQNYTRQSSFNDGDTISASLFNDEYNQLVNAFTYSGSSDSSTGHRHDGSSGQGGNIYRIGDLDFFNKIEADSINNRWGFYVEVGGAAVEQVRIQDGAVVPVTDNDVDLGSVSLEFKDLYLDGTANIDSLVADTADINGGTVDGVVIGATTAAAITGTTLKANTSLELATGATVTAILDEDTLSSDSDTALATQQSIKAYVDAQVTAQDLDVTTDSGTIAIDLDSEVFTVAGGTGLNTSATGNTVTVAIDSTVATLTGTQTLTNKTLTSPDINGGTIDGATIDTSDVTVGAGKTLDVSAGTLTLANNQISGDKVEGGTIAAVTITDLASTTVDTTNIEVTNLKAKDGTSAGSIANATGVVTLASSVLTTADINGGTIDGATIGGASAAAGTFTTLNATGGGSLTGTWSDLGTVTTVDINGGTIDGATIATSDITVGAGKTLDVSAGTFTVANDQISGDAINGGTATPTTLTSTTVNATTVDTTNIEVTNLKAKDGTSAGSIADSTGVVTLASSVLTTTDINGGSVDGVTLGTNSAVTEAQIDNININGNTISSTDTNGNVTITPDGTGSVAISKIDVAGGEIDGTAIGANSASTAVFTDLTASGTVSFSGATVSDGGTVTTVNIDGGSIDGTIIGAASPAAGTFTTVTGTGFASTGDMTFGDNAKAIFGAGSDLQIYHNGSNSYIEDAGTGSLIFRASTATLFQGKTAGENQLTLAENGAVTLYYDNAAKLATTSTGIDVTGTVTATTALEVSSGVPYIDWTDTATTDEDTRAITFNGDFYIGTINDAKTTTKKRFLIDHSTGDISFYEDTGTTPKFFWDASAEALGLGTTSPGATLDISDAFAAVNLESSTGTNQVQVKVSNTGGGAFFGRENSAGSWFGTGEAYATTLRSDGAYPMIFRVNGGNRLVLDDGGNVGIGTTSPAKTLDVRTTTGNDAVIRVGSSGSIGINENVGTIEFYSADVDDAGVKASIANYVTGNQGPGGSVDGNLIFSTTDSDGGGNDSPTERMRITSAGNVAVGTESTGAGGTADKKISVYAGGYNENNTASLVLSGGVGNNNTPSGWSIEAEASGTDGSLVNNLKFGTTSYTGSVDAFTERMRIDSSGRVGIGTSSPSEKLTIDAQSADGVTTTVASFHSNEGEAGDTAIQFAVRRSDSLATDRRTFLNATGEGNFEIQRSGSTKVVLDASGNVGIGVTPSAWVEGEGLNVGSGRGGSIFTETVNYGFTTFNANAFYSATNTWNYVTSNAASRYQQLNGVHSWYNAPSGTAGNTVSFTQAMTLDANNQLLLGTTSTTPITGFSGGSVGLTVQSGLPTIALVDSDDTTNYISWLANSGGTLYLYNKHSTSPLIFGTNNTERARITSGGQFVVNNTTAVLDATLSSLAQSNVAAAAFKSDASTVYAVVSIWGNESSGNQIFARFATDSNSERGSITYNRAVGLVAYNTTSDYRAKDITGPIEDAGSTIDSLKVYSGKMKGASVERPMLIAHEAQEVTPYAVTGEKDAVNEDGTPNYQQMDHSSLVPLLIAEIQSLRARVAQLEGV